MAEGLDGQEVPSKHISDCEECNESDSLQLDPVCSVFEFCPLGNILPPRLDFEPRDLDDSQESDKESLTKERSKMEETAVGKSTSEFRGHENAFGSEKDELFEDIENDDAEDLTLEEKLKILKDNFQVFPPKVIRSILGRQDVKENLQKAYECLEGMSPLKETSKDGEGDGEGAPKDQKGRKRKKNSPIQSQGCNEENMETPGPETFFRKGWQGRYQHQPYWGPQGRPQQQLGWGGFQPQPWMERGGFNPGGPHGRGTNYSGGYSKGDGRDHQRGYAGNYCYDDTVIGPHQWAEFEWGQGECHNEDDVPFPHHGGFQRSQSPTDIRHDGSEQRMDRGQHRPRSILKENDNPNANAQNRPGRGLVKELRVGRGAKRGAGQQQTPQSQSAKSLQIQNSRVSDESTKIFQNLQILAIEKFFPDHKEPGSKEMSNDMESKNKVRTRSEDFKHSETSNYLEDQKYFDSAHHPRVLNKQSERKETGALSLAYDVKEDVDAASSYLNALSSTKGNSSIGEGKGIRSLKGKEKLVELQEPNDFGSKDLFSDHKELDSENLFNNPKNIGDQDLLLDPKHLNNEKHSHDLNKTESEDLFHNSKILDSKKLSEELLHDLKSRGSEDLLHDPKDLNSEKAFDNSKKVGGEKLCQDPNELGSEKLLNEMKSDDKVKPRSEDFEYPEKPNDLQGQKYFDDDYRPRVLNKQSNEKETCALSLEDKVKYLREMFKSIPPLMINRVLLRDDVKEDLDVASNCLKGMSFISGTSSMEEGEKIRSLKSKKKLFNGSMELGSKDLLHDLKDRGSAEDLLHAPKGLNSEKVFDDSKNVGGEKLCQDPNELGSEKLLNEIKSDDKVKPRSEDFKHPEKPNDLQGQKYFDDDYRPQVLKDQSNEKETCALSLEDKAKYLREMFKSIPLLMIKRVLLRDDVKEDLDAASNCLKSMPFLSGTSSMGEIPPLEDRRKYFDFQYPKEEHNTEKLLDDRKVSSDINLFQDPKDKAKRRLESSNLVKMNKVADKTSSSILVSNLSTSTTPDALEFYFSNPRFGGEISSFQYKKGNSQAVVTFRDPDVMQKVLNSRSHTLDDAQLTVEKFIPALQDPNQVHQTGDEIAIVLDQYIMEFATTTNCVPELRESLSVHGYHMTYSSKDSVVKIAPQIGGEILAAREKAIKSVTDFNKRFKAMELDVHKNHWDAVISEISKLHNEIGKNKLLIKESFIEEKVTIICHASDSRDLKKRFLDKIEETRSLETKKSFAKETIDIEKERIRLLNMTAYKDKLLMEYVDLKIDFDQANGQVTIVGPKQQLDHVKISIYQQLSTFCEKKISLLQSVIELLNTEEGHKRIQKELELQQINAVLNIDEDDNSTKNVFVVGIDKDHASKAYNLMERLTTEIKVEVEKGNEDILQTQKWIDLCDEVRRIFHVYVQRNEHFDTWIAGFMVDVSKAHDRMQKFLDEYSIGTETFHCLDKGVRRYIMEHRKGEITSMETALEQYSVNINAGKSPESFSISGTKIGIARSQQSLHLLTSSVAMDEMKVQQPGLRKFFTSGRGDRLVRSIEHENQCAIYSVENAAQSAQSAQLIQNSQVGDENLETTSSDDYWASESDEEENATAQQHSNMSVAQDPLSMMCGNVRISWKQGNIEAENADVLVGSCIGQLSKVFQRAGVSNIQQLRGNVSVVSQCGNLPCNHVIVTECCKWDGGKSAAKRELRAIVQKCLQQALQLGATSIAFPILGTGGLGFPYNTACQIMISEVINVTSGWGVSSLNDIRFVVFGQDAQLVNAFQQEFAASSPTSAPAAVGLSIFSRLAQVTRFSRRSVPTAGTTNAFGNVTVQVFQGDLTKEQTDAIVNINGTDMNMKNAGALSKAVAKAAGPTVQDECTTLGQQVPGSAVVTCAGKLKAKNIIHMIPGKADVQHTQSCIEECLRVADSKRLQSISMPAFGTGGYGMSEADSAQATFQALDNECPNLQKLRQIRIVVFQPQMVSIFQQTLQQYLTRSSKQSQIHKLPTADETAKPSTASEKLEDVACGVKSIQFRLFGESKASVDRAKKALRKGLSEACKTQTVENEEVSKLSKRQRDKLKSKARQLDVIIKFEDRMQRIEVRGDSEDVTAIINHIWEEIQERSKKERVKDLKSNPNKGIALPKKWCQMPLDSNGREKTGHLVELTKGSAEYQKVHNLFQKTGGSGKIVKIERIQNPHLYKQYVVRKQKMDKDNKGMNNERKLFHGTADLNVNDINERGFNRSYCGAHGVAYGKGVYFARDASYSTRYSQSTSGNRPMYLARVLIGKYAQGNSAMIVPPKGFDSVADSTGPGASIFVVFYDAQCYPEYLITFQ